MNASIVKNYKRIKFGLSEYIPKTDTIIDKKGP